MMNRGETLDSIPIDISFEIFSRLPTKSIVRFRCVSKLWNFRLRQPDFTELFLNWSSARPRLLFAVQESREWSFYSSPQLQNPYEKSSLVVVADFHMKFCKYMWPDFRGFTFGLIYFSKVYDDDDGRVICNPLTGQYAMIPDLKKCGNEYIFLGFDPIGNEVKVLSMNYHRDNNHILILRRGKMSWRKIKCPLTHKPLSKGICINGVLYYLARSYFGKSDVIVCFYVRSEKFKFVESKCISFLEKLINYKGKLGWIKLTNRDGDGAIELNMWVLEDVEKQEWLKHVYTLPKNEVFDSSNFRVAGVTSRGEIVLSMKYTCKPFYVFYFNPEKNTLQRVEIQGNNQMLEKRNRVYAFVDYVKDLKFDIAKTTYAATYISPLELKRKRDDSANKFDALYLLDDDDQVS